MSDQFSLGKKENLGDIDFSKIRSGLSKKDLGIEEGSVLSSIFDSINTNNEGNSEGKLDKSELNQFILTIKKLAKKDKTLSEKEAGKYKINGEKIDKSGKELLNFLTKLAQTTEEIESIVTEGKKEIIKYTNGNVYEEEIFEDGSKFIKETSGKYATEKVYDANGNEIRTTYFEDGKITNDRYVEYDDTGNPVSAETISTQSTYYDKEKFQQGIEGSIYTKYKYDKEKHDFVEIESTSTYVDDATNTVINRYINYVTGDYENLEVINGLCRSQVVSIDGKMTRLEYDEQGCLLGYVVQPGDTVESIAEKFGVSKDLLIRANSQSNFLVLDKIRIPKQFAIDDPALKNMKSYEEAWEKSPKVIQTWHDPSTGEDWQEELVIVKDNLKHGWKVTCDKNGQYYVFTKDNKYISDEEVQDQLYWDSLPKIQVESSDGSKIQLGVIKSGLPYNRKYARDRAGNVYIVSHDNKILSDEYVAKKDLWDNSEKITGSTKSKGGGWIVSEYVVVKEGLKNGIKIVMDKDLNYHYMDAAGNICDEKVAEEQAIENIRNEPKTAMKATLMILKEMYKNAKAAFDKQISEQGWTAEVADAISIIWGSENRAEVVAKDLANYANQIKTLEACMQRGDFDEFKKIFKDLFKVDFRPWEIAEYIKDPSEKRYINAFGVDNNIAQRVAKYNESQNFGSGIVRTVTSALGAVLAALAVPYTGGASAVIIGASGAAISSLIVGLSDRASSDVGLRDGDLEDIVKTAAWDGVSVLAGGAAGKFAKTVITGASKAAAMGRAAVNIAADTTVGVAQEYVESGTVTIEGVASNMILSGAGSAISSLHIKSGKVHKSYSNMKPEDLLDEYNKLHLQTTTADIDLKIKAQYIKMMKEIESTLKKQGYKIEDLRLKSVKDGSTQPVPVAASQETDINVKQQLKAELGKDLYNMHEMVVKSMNKITGISDVVRLKEIISTKFKDFKDVASNLLIKLDNNAKKIGIRNTSSEQLKILERIELKNRKARLGRRLARYYNKMENAIDSMTDIQRFDKLLDKITTKFADFKYDMKVLLEKLYDKAKAIGLSVKESLENVYARIGIKNSSINPLDKYTFSKRGISMHKSHAKWINSRKDLFGDNMHEFGCWSGYKPADQRHGAWKMHLFSVDEADWRKMCDVIIPYLKEKDIDWKTFNARYDASYLNGSKQQGKAFTIYPKNNEDMAQIAKDLDYIIRKNKLEMSGSHITGDRQMGSTGRLFYRYEFKSGKYKDEILDLSKDHQEYLSRYDANRGEGKYLADDMTIEDDIWRNFDPSDLNAQPAASPHFKSGKYRLFKGQSYQIGRFSKINLANIMTIDLNNSAIKSRILSLSENEQLTIGREGDIRVKDPSQKISRVHVIIYKRNGKFYIVDNSANGTTMQERA